MVQLVDQVADALLTVAGHSSQATQVLVLVCELQVQVAHAQVDGMQLVRLTPQGAVRSLAPLG